MFRNKYIHFQTALNDNNLNLNLKFQDKNYFFENQIISVFKKLFLYEKNFQ